MSEEAGSGAVAPVAPVTTPTVQPQVTADDQNPTWLPDRLKRAEEQARTKLLADLGVTDPEKAKAAIAAAAKAEEEKKSHGEKLGEATTKLSALEQENAELRGAVALIAEQRLAALTEEQRAAVTELAGDDAHAQLVALKALEPTWKPKTPAPAATATPPPAPQNTAPPPNAPGGAQPVSPPNHKATYEQLKKNNPHAAAAYFNKYGDEIYPRAN